MSQFAYHHNELCAEQVPLTQIATQFGTPCYVYSRATIEQQWQMFDRAFTKQAHRICYAVKANSNLAILNVLARLGSGFDVVSAGEIARVLAAGGLAEKIVFSGVGKLNSEIQYALEKNIFCFNIESKSELTRLDQIAGQMGKTAAISLRINPDIPVDTHPYIATGLKENKFGTPIDDALELFLYAKTLGNLKIIGIACHLGSQLMTADPYMLALDRLLQLVTELKEHKINLQHVNLGGGIGVCYHTENPLTPEEYAQAILPKLQNQNIELILEPGRAIVAEAGVLLTKVEYIKHHGPKNFAIVDAAMNDLIRPALYEAWHGILAVKPHTDGLTQLFDVVGPVCETSDFLGKNRHLSLTEGDLLAICTAGAYGFTMSSNYNSRPRVAEVLVDGNKVHLIREREQIADLFAKEKIVD